MGNPKFTGTLVGSDGSKLIILDAELTPVSVIPPPPIDPPKPTQTPNTVRIGSATYPLSAINPNAVSNPLGSAFPGIRGPNQLVMYQAPLKVTVTNAYGHEVTVMGGMAGVGGVNQTQIPADGYVLSGHGKAMDFLLTNASVGAKVELIYIETPKPSDPPVTSGHTIGVYLMDGVGHISQVPPQCNRILVAFYQGTDLVEWGGDSRTQTAADLKAWHAGRSINEILVSLGGQGGNVVLDQVDEGMARINRQFPVDGIDFDAEAFGYTPAQAVSIAQLSAQAVGKLPKDFIVQFVPPGGPPVESALAAAKACQAAGFRVQLGQQGYETSISDADVISYTQRAVNVLGAPSVIVGMMLGDAYNSWTVTSAESRMRAVVAKWPTIGGVYLWESSRAGTTEWGRAMGRVLGS